MAKKRDEDKLIILLPEEILNQMERIFEQLAEDEEMRTRFAEDPAAVLREIGVDVPADTDFGLINRVVFHLMGDEAFIAWSYDYNEELRERYGATITVDEEIAKAIAKDIDTAIREHLPPKLKAEYTRAGGAAAASFFFVGITILVTVAAVFNAAAAVNAVALWNIGASIDHLVGLDIGVNELVRAALLLLVSVSAAGAPFGAGVQAGAAGAPVGVGVRVGGAGGWPGPDA